MSISDNLTISGTQIAKKVAKLELFFFCFFSAVAKRCRPSGRTGTRGSVVLLLLVFSSLAPHLDFMKVGRSGIDSVNSSSAECVNRRVAAASRWNRTDGRTVGRTATCVGLSFTHFTTRPIPSPHCGFKRLVHSSQNRFYDGVLCCPLTLKSCDIIYCSCNILR